MESLTAHWFSIVMLVVSGIGLWLSFRPSANRFTKVLSAFSATVLAISSIALWDANPALF
jgi:uncharacterized membrane protein